MKTPAKVEWKSSSHPVSDIRDWSRRHRLEMKPDFQRNQVWSRAAKIMLIDTILRNIPMPKIFLQAILREQDTYRIVIDGQQRLTAILEFLDGKFSLDPPYEGPYLSMPFSELPENVQGDILNYNIDVNEIRNATKEIIRDVYSRVNKYTVQLNKQELRRADYPGDFLKLSEEIARNPFFEENHVFTIASARRMGDVEFVSELLALLLAGPQEKKEDLDSFYAKFKKWPENSKREIQTRFKSVLVELQSIWRSDKISMSMNPFSKSRFRQKADFYALFNAIDDLLMEGCSISQKDIAPLCADLAFLDERIEPESEIQIFRKYAIQCVSQSNTIGSRRWRRNILKTFLGGTYKAQIPPSEVIRSYHNILIEAKLPFESGICPVCGKAVTLSDCSSQEVVLSWPKCVMVYQLSNARLVHRNCIANTDGFVAVPKYTTGDLDEAEFRTET